MRDLDWDGGLNVRDLGGLPVEGGGVTRWGAVVRAGNLDLLTGAGWAALHAYGVRTVVALREAGERAAGVSRPAGVDVVHVPLDDTADTEFWYRCIDEEIDGTPLYYRPFLARNAERCAAAVAAVARARPGGVVVHCGIGRDRTGLVSLLLLALAGVTPDAIASDYALSAERLRPYFAEAYAAHGDVIAARMARHGVTVPDAIRAVLADQRPADWIAAGDVHAVRERLGRTTSSGSDGDGQA
ncbi:MULTISPECIES: tyrosine-protein phosphatase [Catenuloplanes]|uniref:Protein tyrosine/serine phosphatase n=1 Tax=Catenuloplanes niger TaxID=587534 RepID=A0AAE3ZNZ3_9ACTN|nr:tyrosine-protein phosphatase [Catenuloplanes niger]MDR7322397.1 protein tyrosine/serine phosphatase [Catenuloplanes niger]